MGCNQTKQADLKKAARNQPDRQRAPLSTSEPSEQHSPGGGGQGTSTAQKIGPKHYGGLELRSHEFQVGSVTEKHQVEQEAFQQDRAKQRERNIVEGTASAMFDLSQNIGAIDEMELDVRNRHYEEYVYGLQMDFKPIPMVIAKPPTVNQDVSAADIQMMTTLNQSLLTAMNTMAVQSTESIVVPFPPIPGVQ